jgi:hypothetical protein
LVTEDSSLGKRRTIESNAYLAHTYATLRSQRLDVPIVIFGSSLSEHDHHLTARLRRRTPRASQADIYARLEAEPLVFFDATTHPLGSAELAAWQRAAPEPSRQGRRVPYPAIPAEASWSPLEAKLVIRSAGDGRLLVRHRDHWRGRGWCGGRGRSALVHGIGGGGRGGGLRGRPRTTSLASVPRPLSARLLPPIFPRVGRARRLGPGASVPAVARHGLACWRTARRSHRWRLSRRRHPCAPAAGATG